MKYNRWREKAFLRTWSTFLSISNTHGGCFAKKKFVLEQIGHDFSTL